MAIVRMGKDGNEIDMLPDVLIVIVDDDTGTGSYRSPLVTFLVR